MSHGATLVWCSQIYTYGRPRYQLRRMRRCVFRARPSFKITEIRTLWPPAGRKMATGSSSKSDSSAPANKLESIQKALHQFLHTPSAVTPVFELIEKNAKLKREYLFLGRLFSQRTFVQPRGVFLCTCTPIAVPYQTSSEVELGVICPYFVLCLRFSYTKACLVRIVICQQWFVSVYLASFLPPSLHTRPRSVSGALPGNRIWGRACGQSPGVCVPSLQIVSRIN